MVFGWGKKKKSLEFETTIQEEKEIKLDEINSKVADMAKTYHSGMVKKSILINASRDKVWKKVSNIDSLWLN